MKKAYDVTKYLDVQFNANKKARKILRDPRYYSEVKSKSPLQRDAVVSADEILGFLM